MNLADILEKQYLLRPDRTFDRKTIGHYKRSMQRLREMLGREPLASDLTDETIGGLMRWLQMTRGVEAETANHARKCLVALWRWCRDKEILRSGPTVKKLKVPKRLPRAWSVEEWQRLVKAIDSQTGTIGGLPAPTWWLTLLTIEMDAGIRASELLALRWEWIDWERSRIYVPAEVRKGKSEDWSYWIPQMTRDWLWKLRQPSGLILGAGVKLHKYYTAWDNLLEEAGLPCDAKNKTQMARRTFATALKLNGGNPTKALGHSSDAVTIRHYLAPESSDDHHAACIPDAMRPLMIAGLRVVEAVG